MSVEIITKELIDYAENKKVRAFCKLLSSINTKDIIELSNYRYKESYNEIMKLCGKIANNSRAVRKTKELFFTAGCNTLKESIKEGYIPEKAITAKFYFDCILNLSINPDTMYVLSLTR
ncbi:MAG: hypothetical protein AB1485_05255 [Candidatus Thermoplasmatota archaeon]